MRSLLQTPELRDETTFVRWMQLGRWHVDLRIPEAARSPRVLLAEQQGFSGVTEVTADEAGELCTWHRLVDYQPPRPHPDAGLMIFETPDLVTEIGVHGIYREVWHRLPDSTSRFWALAEPRRADAQTSARLFVAGRYLMRVRPSAQPGPAFEISFGTLEPGCWRITHSSRPELEGHKLACRIERLDATLARVELEGDSPSAGWTILEWSGN